MFEIATVGKNGQITLPRALRQRMQVGAGDLISFEQKGDEIVMKPVRAEDAFGEIRGRGILIRKYQTLRRDISTYRGDPVQGFVQASSSVTKYLRGFPG